MKNDLNKNKLEFTHLHVHSHYSLLDGLGKIEDLLARAKELGMKSLALTDHGTMYGAVEFYQKAKEQGVRPIIGCEMYVTPGDMESKQPKLDEKRYHLVLLAKNEKGYKNLMKLVTEAHLRGFYYKPRIDKELLAKHSEGLIGTSACMAGEIPQAIRVNAHKKAKKLLKEYQEILGRDNFYLEIEPPAGSEIQRKVNKGIIELARETETPLVATSDVHYVKKEDKEVQDVLLCIQQNKKVQDKQRLKMTTFDLYLKSAEEMATEFPEAPEALTNTMKIAEQCQFDLKMGKSVLPYFEIPANQDENNYLRKLCLEGVKERYGKGDSKEVEHENEIKERLDFELEVIAKMGYASYFLIVADFVNWAKNNKIVVGPGRGSAAGSIVSYLLGITNVDPIKYELLFERFLNPDRISMPDIDIDFADNRRDEVIEYVAKKYGRDKVAQIITFGTMAARAAIRDAGRALDHPYEVCDKIAKEVPMFTKLEDALNKSQELARLYKEDPGAKQIINMARRLEGVVRHASTHACGVVITKDSLTEYAPLQRNTSSGKEKTESIVTQYEGKSVEALGLLKMDFLGLRNLTILQNVIDIIRAKYKEEVDLDKIPMADKKTLELFAKGETTGVFQFESAGFKRYLKELQPSRFQDLIDMVALYRPGPMEWIPDYIAGKHGKRKITFLHPKLKPILEKTYGIIVVQEQVMEISKQLAGFTAGEADYLRKAMGKKIKKLMEEQRDKFVLGCINQGIKGTTAEKIWDFIKPFAGYGFNWAHSACYAMIGYQTAYFKAHYPVEFMAALLSSDEDNTDRITIEIDECRKMGIEVKPPDVNASYGRFAVINEGGKAFIYYGLNAVKNVGKHIAKVIVEERKKNGEFKSVADFAKRVLDKDLNKKSLESLAKSGALDSIGEREEVLENVDRILKFAKEMREIKERGQSSLFGGGESEDDDAWGTGLDLTLDPVSTEGEAAEKDKAKQRLTWEKELLGVYLTDNPLREYEPFLRTEVKPINQLAKIYQESEAKRGNGINGGNGQFNGYPGGYQRNVNRAPKAKVAGMITKVKKIFTKNNQEMVFAEIEDLSGSLELVVFPKIYAKDTQVWQEDKVIWAKGKMDDKDGNLKILCDQAGEITERMLNRARKKEAEGGTAVEESETEAESKKNQAGDNSVNISVGKVKPADDSENISPGSEKNDTPKSNNVDTTNENFKNAGDLVIQYDQEKGNASQIKALLKELRPGEGKIILAVNENNGATNQVKIAGTYDFSGPEFQALTDYLEAKEMKFNFTTNN